MDAQREALAFRFIAGVLGETTTWQPELQLALYQLAFSTLPEMILRLDPDRARSWARSWRAEQERMAAAPPAELPADALAWVEQLSREWNAQQTAPLPAASIEETQRLADLFTRFGGLALGLPWRNDPPPKA